MKTLKEELEGAGMFYAWDTIYECGLEDNKLTQDQNDLIVTKGYYGMEVTEESIDAFIAGKSYPVKGKYALRITACDGTHWHYHNEVEHVLTDLARYIIREDEVLALNKTYTDDDGRSVRAIEVVEAKPDQEVVEEEVVEEPSIQYVIDFDRFVNNKEVHTKEMMGNVTLRVYKIAKSERGVWEAYCTQATMSMMDEKNITVLPITRDWRDRWSEGEANKYGEELYTLGHTTNVLLAKSDALDWREVENINHDVREFVVWWNDKSIETAQIIDARSPQDAIRFCYLDDMDFYNEVPEKTEYYAREVL